MALFVVKYIHIQMYGRNMDLSILKHKYNVENCIYHKWRNWSNDKSENLTKFLVISNW